MARVAPLRLVGRVRSLAGALPGVRHLPFATNGSSYGAANDAVNELPPVRVLMFGDESLPGGVPERLSSLARLLRERFGVPVSIARPGEDVAVHERATMAICTEAAQPGDVAALSGTGVPLVALIDSLAPVHDATLTALSERAAHLVFPSAALAGAFDERGTRTPTDVACRHVLDDAGGAADHAFSLLELVHSELRRVSVVVPNFDYARYLPGRLASVFEQRYPVFETIVLDDGSRDDSVRVIERVARASARQVRLEANATNGGGVFAQWRKGATLARGEHVWIAEADDLADPRFLGASVAAVRDESIVLSFADSAQIGAADESLAPDYHYYYRRVDPTLFDADFVMDGREFVRRALGERNVILNASAVLWRREALVRALASVGSELDGYRLVGDWRLYLEALGQPRARVAHVAAPLNVHRRHPTSVTHAIDVERHLTEIRAMHVAAAALFGADTAREARAIAYLDELRVQFARPSAA